MSVRYRIRIDQLRVGAPLAVDVYDSGERLLLRRGNVIATEAQLERLIREGLFSDQPLPTEAGATTPSKAEQQLIDGEAPTATSKPRVRVPVYSEVVTIAKHLELLHAAPASRPDFVEAVEHLARTLVRACALDPDAALATIMFARDVRYPVRQQINVAIIASLVLERAEADPARTHSAVCAALTMNLTIGALQDVLYRQRQMTSEQRVAIDEHPAAAAKQLEALGVRDPLWLACVAQHHEFVDGSGYPNKLAGDAVLPEAQVLGLADRYCAAVTERGYRQAVAPEVTLGFIRTKSGPAIRTEWIDRLTHVVGIYPPGTVVSLFNRDVAVVTRRLRDTRHPVIYAIAPQNLRPFAEPRKRLTASNPQFEIEKVVPREQIVFPVAVDVLWPSTVTADAGAPETEIDAEETALSLAT